ncbi:MAG: AAA family ATPase, partial [Desulfotignum sp.]|nr:AAA family ATPase [Desulfotignum sp.]
MKIGDFDIFDVLRTETYKTVYSALSGRNRLFLHEYSNPETADHEFMISRMLDGSPVDRFIEKFEFKTKTVLVQAPFDGLYPARYVDDTTPLPKKIAVAESVLAVLKEIHEKGVVYNNLSLDTITIGANGDVMLHNLASAVIVGDDTTLNFHQIFNPHFVAPECTERAAGGPSAKSDYYSFGVLLYWLFTGKRPFEADTISQLISLHVAGRPDPPGTLNLQLPDGLSKIVMQLLEKEPSSRYKSIEGILYDLAHYEDPDFQPGSQDMDLKFTISEKIYGREREMALLREALDELGDDKAGLVTISGYSGVGKSTIVSEFQKSLKASECRLISGKFQQYKKDVPYFAIVEAFESLFDMLLLSDQAVLDDFRNTFADSIGDQGRLLTAIFPKLELIVGPQARVDKLVGEEAENRFNYVFLKLIDIVATRQRPLVLFLDDLQWTDLVSLNVLRAVFQNDTRHLLVVLCYRSNEVDPHHPFQQFLDEVDTHGVRIQTIDVRDLQPVDVSQLIKDSMGCDHPDLTRLVFEKTHGNAFFVHQLLKGLADRDYFQRDVKNKIWTIDLGRVKSLQVSGNVVEFMQTRLNRLPRAVSDLLSIIGAVGHHVDLDLLSVITEKSRAVISQTLQRPFEDGLLFKRHNHIYFAHDKIQQACYQLNRISELPRLHFTIARTLIDHDLLHSTDDLFNLVGHLDKGFFFIDQDVEQYIDLYMMAALKSKEISAYKEFLIYVDQAMSLIQDSLSDSIRYQVYREYHIALYLNSRFDEADDFFNQYLIGYEDLLALRENYFSKVSQDSMRRNYKAATEFGMAILEKMGIDLNIDPQMADLARELDEVEALFQQAGITKISDLQDIEQKNIDEMTFISELILAMVPAAFFYNPTVACLLIFTTLKLAVRNGVFEAMGYPLSVASTPFIIIRNDYQAGYAYAEYAMQIAAGNKRSLGNSKHLFVLFCWHWSNPMKNDTALEIARDAHHLLMQGGDIQMAGYTYYNTVTYLWERGDRLESVRTEVKKGLEFNERTQNLHGTALITPHYQVVQTLLSEEGDFVTLSIDGFSEAEFIEKNDQNAMGLCFFYIYKTQLAYLFGAYEPAYAFSLKARALLHYITGFPSTQAGVFYGALSACSVLDPAGPEWASVEGDLAQLKQWNTGAPENFEHKLYFLEAEMARKKGDTLEAIQRYTDAVSASKQNRFFHETALICERFSSFWQDLKNSELSEYYAGLAFHYYDAWGAKRKCDQLRQSYSHVYLESTTQDLDLMTVIHSQNILARETNIENLLRQMMQILLEVSGAERGFLVLKQDGWAIEAFRNSQGDESILQSLPLEKEQLGVDMINYVIRTGRKADLDQFAGHLDDGYLNRVHPQSLIVLPAKVSSQMMAVIYLEHTRIRKMFTAKKLEMITLLSTQIAISLNNAKIYNHLEQLVQERTRKLAARNEELALARKKAEDANEAKSEFLANMSHELRTPLNAVTGFSELLASVVSDPRQKSYLDAIQVAGRSLLTLINDILDLSKIEAGRLDIACTPVNLNAIFMEIEQIFDIKIREKNLAFSSTHSQDLPDWLFLDEIRIRQVLLNLVGNAVKFTEEGYVKISAHYAPKDDNSGDLTLSVEDTGIGIRKEEQEKIFDSFEQQSGQDTARYGGTGLGLTITRRLVELMDGTLSVSSTPGRGSRFTVEFKNVKIASSEIQSLETASLTFENIEFSPARVLAVDDIESNRILLKEILSKVGLDAVTAKNGQEALLLAKELRPALILMDIRMPVLSGLDAAEQLKKQTETADIPIIALTASSTKKEKTLAFQKGFDGFLPKPLNFDRLMAELSRHLAHTAVDRKTAESVRLSDPIDMATIQQPGLLSHRLKTEVIPHFQRLKKAFVASDCQRLAQVLETLGKEC